MHFLFFDTETHLIKPGCPAPRLVCVSTCVDGTAKLFDRARGLYLVRAALEDSKTALCGHNVFYDLGVVCAEDPKVFVPLVFRAFEERRVRDTQVRQQLQDIQNGCLKFVWDEEREEYRKTGYTLADLALRLLGRVLPKADTWRLRYALLDGIPIEKWPPEARQYAMDDASTTRDVFWRQTDLSTSDEASRMSGGVFPTEERVTREAWALWLMSAWGIRTDGEAVVKLKAELEKEQTEVVEKLTKVGIYKQDPRKGTWSKNMATIYQKVAAGFTAQGKTPGRTGKGKLSTDHKALLESGDPDLKVLADAAGGAKLLSTYVPVLDRGTKYPINARYNVLVESNRTSCSKPNCQNPPRKGGVRECFVARPGYVYCSCDYDTIELRSLAQTCLDLLGTSEMAEALRAGEDLHLNLAADFMGITRDESRRRYEVGDVDVSDKRQLMKPANFGFPGGMAPDSFVSYAAGYGFDISTDLAKQIYEQWHRAWPEMRHYFNWISNEVGSSGEGKITIQRTGFVRGGLRFTQAANHFFQSLTATGAKDALWHVTRECYNDRTSPLWGSRPVIFMHDEIIAEMPEAQSAEAAERMAKIMVDVMQRWIPDIPIKASPVLMRRWYKGAKPLRVDGKLVPSRPHEQDGKLKWLPDV
jgi:hypothetical protein